MTCLCDSQKSRWANPFFLATKKFNLICLADITPHPGNSKPTLHEAYAHTSRGVSPHFTRRKPTPYGRLPHTLEALPPRVEAK